MEEFLLSRKPEDASVTGEASEAACREYLAEALREDQVKRELTSVRRILSNPMDLTLVSYMLSRGEKPDLFRLQEQQYKIMADDYQRTNLQEFPLGPFSENVYQMRLSDRSAIPGEKFLSELECMERNKMVVTRFTKDAEDNPIKTWRFRHDKIMEFFIVQTFLGENNDYPEKHLGDPRFGGVYFLLATLMRLEDAEALREQLVDYAADTKDHTVSDTFVQLLRVRKAA